MLMPKITKYRKQQKGRIKGNSNRGNKISFGEFGIFAMEQGYITSRQIESARVAIMRAMKKGGKVWIRIFPDKPMTKKPAETRMGKGKGDIDQWAACIKPGRCLFEIGGIEEETARRAMTNAGYKLPVKTKFRVRIG